MSGTTQLLTPNTNGATSVWGLWVERLRNTTFYILMGVHHQIHIERLILMTVGLLVSILLAYLPGFICATPPQLLCWAGGSCETIPLCISLCLIVRCFASLFITRMICTSYDQDAMHFIWSCLLTTLIHFAYLVDFCIYCLPTVVSDDTTLGA